MIEKSAIDFARPIPLFPLPNCILLPHATIPLHIFEPRYRQLLADALDSNGLIAMSVFDGEDWKSDYQGTPPLRPDVCVGYVIRHEKVADGRSNLLLQGLCRARIEKEVQHQPYRIAFLKPTEPQPPMEIDLSECRERIEALLNDPLLKQLAAISAIYNWLSAEIPTTALVDLAFMRLCSDSEKRYAMLAEPDACARATQLEEMLHSTRRTLKIAQRYGCAQTADGACLN